MRVSTKVRALISNGAEGRLKQDLEDLLNGVIRLERFAGCGADCAVLEEGAVPCAAYIPDSVEDAQECAEGCMCDCLQCWTHDAFMYLWCAVVYLNPTAHPDDVSAQDSGWAERFKPVVYEAFRRAKANLITDDELYPSAVIAGRIRKG